MLTTTLTEETSRNLLYRIYPSANSLDKIDLQSAFQSEVLINFAVIALPGGILTLGRNKKSGKTIVKINSA